MTHESPIVLQMFGSRKGRGKSGVVGKKAKNIREMSFQPQWITHRTTKYTVKCVITHGFTHSDIYILKWPAAKTCTCTLTVPVSAATCSSVGLRVVLCCRSERAWCWLPKTKDHRRGGRLERTEERREEKGTERSGPDSYWCLLEEGPYLGKDWVDWENKE